MAVLLRLPSAIHAQKTWTLCERLSPPQKADSHLRSALSQRACPTCRNRSRDHRSDRANVLFHHRGHRTPKCQTQACRKRQWFLRRGCEVQNHMLRHGKATRSEALRKEGPIQWKRASTQETCWQQTTRTLNAKKGANASLNRPPRPFYERFRGSPKRTSTCSRSQNGAT